MTKHKSNLILYVYQNSEEDSLDEIQGVVPVCDRVLIW